MFELLLALLSTLAEAVKALLLLALPEVASPAVVLCQAEAEPLRALWLLLLLALKLLLFLTCWLLCVYELFLLAESGPVPLLSAAAKPVVSPMPMTVAAAMRANRAFIFLPPKV
jgi:hypothetical protein